jgi:hypothetical protein
MGGGGLSGGKGRHGLTLFVGYVEGVENGDRAG